MSVDYIPADEIMEVLWWAEQLLKEAEANKFIMPEWRLKKLALLAETLRSFDFLNPPEVFVMAGTPDKPDYKAIAAEYWPEAPEQKDRGPNVLTFTKGGDR
jgi:hypothetical protein